MTISRVPKTSLASAPAGPTEPFTARIAITFAPATSCDLTSASADVWNELPIVATCTPLT